MRFPRLAVAGIVIVIAGASRPAPADDRDLGREILAPNDGWAAWNAVNDPDLTPTISWVPTRFTEIEATRDVPSSVQNDAGVFAGSVGPNPRRTRYPLFMSWTMAATAAAGSGASMTGRPTTR